jgi:hypothetical protein
MSVMIEIYYRSPEDISRERRIETIAGNHGGSFTFRENEPGKSICLTAEFDSWEKAEAAAAEIRESGEHVEGPSEYGDS